MPTITSNKYCDVNMEFATNIQMYENNSTVRYICVCFNLKFDTYESEKNVTYISSLITSFGFGRTNLH